MAKKKVFYGFLMFLNLFAYRKSCRLCNAHGDSICSIICCICMLNETSKFANISYYLPLCVSFVTSAACIKLHMHFTVESQDIFTFNGFGVCIIIPCFWMAAVKNWEGKKSFNYNNTYIHELNNSKRTKANIRLHIDWY